MMSVRPIRVLAMHWGKAGGGPKFALQMARALSVHAAAEVHTSSHRDSDLAPDWLVVGAGGYQVRTYEQAWQVVGYWPRLLRNIVRTRNYIKRHQIEVVYAPMFSIWQSLAVRLYLPHDVTFIATVHDAREHPGEESFVQRACQRAEVMRAELVVVHSASVEDILRSRGMPAAALAHIPHGVEVSTDESRTSAALPPEPTIGFFGRILPYKGVDLFASAISELRSRGVAVRGEAWGQGDAGRNALNTDVDWRLEWIPESEVESTIRRFDVLVLPYKEASQSGVLSLAAGLGIPAVVTPVGGLAEQADLYGNALLTRDVSALAIADAIAHLLTDPDTYDGLAAAGVESARSGRSSWAEAARQLLERIEEIRK